MAHVQRASGRELGHAAVAAVTKLYEHPPYIDIGVERKELWNDCLVNEAQDIVFIILSATISSSMCLVL